MPLKLLRFIVFGFVFGGLTLSSVKINACSPYANLTVTNQIVGTQLQINITSNTAWNCCYSAGVELVCASASFTGNYAISTNQICKSNNNFTVPYNQLNIDISAYCPGTQLKFRATEIGSGLITSAYTVTVPGVLSPLSVGVVANPATICVGGCVDINATPAGQCGNVSYSWSIGGGGATTNVCPVVPTTYSVTITNPGDACSGVRSASSSVNIGIDPPPVAGIASVQPTAVCFGEDVSLTLTGSVGNIQWQSSSNSGGPWLDLAGATSDTYTFQNLTSNLYFAAKVYNACEDLFSNVILATVLPLPIANFNFSSVCEGNPTVFSDLSQSVSIASWSWDFGDGIGTSIEPSPVYTYVQFGTYDVTLIVTSTDGCVDQVTQQVIVKPQPIADFSFVEVCALQSTLFTDGTQLAAGAIASWNWDFDGQAADITTNPSHIFPIGGTYNVTLNVTTDVGCSDEITLPVISFPVPSAQFLWSDVCDGFVSAFTDQSTVAFPGQITVWNWDFGDGLGTSNLASDAYFYSSQGTYSVSIMVETADGCTNQATNQVQVFPSPISDFDFTNICQSDGAVFQNLATVTGSAITGNFWDFGNGTSILATPPPRSYSQDGSYNVSLIVETVEGCRDTLQRQIIVFPDPVTDFLFTEVCLGDLTDFVDLSSIASGNIVSWDWNFGDNQGSDVLPSPSYLYESDGNYSVILSLVSDFGCTNQLTQSVEVYPLPISNFSVTNICNDVPEVFVNLSTGGSISRWDFGDGTTSLDDQPLPHVYATFGTYLVELIIETGSGCSDTLTQQLEVYAVPVADFTFDTVCFPLPTTFSDLSSILGTDQITNWDWRFGDAGVDATQNPLHNYGQWGDYIVTLTVTSENGCVDDTIIGPARVHPKPQAIFDDAIANCHQDTTTFQDLSSIANEPLDSLALWTWNFGDGTTTAIPNPTHLYANEGMFDATLAILTNHGCADTITHQVEIYPLPRVAFAADTTRGCQPFRAQFLDETTIPSPYNLSRWEWNFGDSSELVSAQFPVHTYLTDTLGPIDEGVFTVSLTVTSGNGCVSSATYPNYMTEYPRPDAWFDVDPKRAELLFARMQVTDLSSINVSNWEYHFGDGATAIVQNPQHTYSDTGTFTITQYVATQYGCLDTAEFTVIVDPEFYFYIPNTFTPNNEGHNETFFGTGVGVIGYAMVIFDRWGSQVFESGAEDLHWDGTKNGHPVQQGVYTYMFNIIDIKGNPHEYVGHVNLMR